MSQINAFLERIAAIELGVNIIGTNPDGSSPDVPIVVQADPYQPSNVASVSVPCWINEVYGGTSDLPIASGQQYRTTKVRMALLLARRTAGIDLMYNVQTTALWADAVYATFAQHLRLSYPAMLITASTNTSPIQLTIGQRHYLTDGQQVTVANHLINTNANGAWNITVVDEYNITLNGSTGNGVGGATGTERLTQPFDQGNVVSAVIKNWDIKDYPYGDSASIEGQNVFIALVFELAITEMYVTSIQE